MAALRKLDEMGYKPKKKKTRESKERRGLSEGLDGHLEKTELLDLLIEGLAESDTREVIIYGAYVKKHLTSIIPVSREKRIEKTLECLSRMIEDAVKSSKIM